MPDATPLDWDMAFQRIPSSPSFYIIIRRHEGGVILLNAAHVVSLNFYPGPPDIANAWTADMLQRYEEGRFDTPGSATATTSWRRP